MPEDSVDQLTINYPAHLNDIKDGDTAWIRKVNERCRMMWAAEGMTAENTLIDTSFIVHDRLFSVTGSRFFVAPIKRTWYRLKAVTAVRGLEIVFEFEMIQAREDSIAGNLAPNAINIIKTIRFSTPV